MTVRLRGELYAIQRQTRTSATTRTGGLISVRDYLHSVKSNVRVIRVNEKMWIHRRRVLEGSCICRWGVSGSADNGYFAARD